MNIDTILDSLYTMPETSKNLLKDHIQEVSFPKGHLLIKADIIEKNIFFVKQGIVRAYSTFPDHEATFWFGKEGDTAISMKSYVDNKKGYENIDLLENSSFYHLDSDCLQDLYTRDLHIANWGRKFAEHELIKTEERLISRLFKTATERYIELMKENPELLRRVQLGYIASYLGITQVSLSRIRASI